MYAADYPWFFTPNVFAVASDGLKLRFGAVGRAREPVAAVPVHRR